MKQRTAESRMKHALDVTIVISVLVVIVNVFIAGRLLKVW